MAWEKPISGGTFSLPASGDLSGKQFYFVKLAATPTACVVCSSSLDVPIGVLQNKPTSGHTADIMAIGITKLIVAATPSLDAEIGTDANGKAIAYTPGTNTVNYIVGRLLEAGAAADDLVTAMINCYTPGRAA